MIHIFQVLLWSHDGTFFRMRRVSVIKINVVNYFGSMWASPNNLLLSFKLITQQVLDNLLVSVKGHPLPVLTGLSSLYCDCIKPLWLYLVAVPTPYYKW